MISRKPLFYLCAAICLAALGLFAVSCGGSRANARTEPGASPSPTPVEVSTVAAITRQLPRYFEATGSLAANVQTDVQPQTAGKVIAVGVDLGSVVHRGQMIAKLEDADYRIRLDQANALLENATAAVKQAEEKIALQPDQKFDPEKVPDVAAARANYDLAEKNLERAQKLIDSGDVSRSYLDQQRSVRDSLRETYQAALARARQDYAAVLVARTNVTNARTQVDLARRNLSYTIIASPIDGSISDRPVDVGEYVTTTTKIATVVSTNPLRMRIDIPEQAIPNVRQGESVSLTTSAWPDRSFAGHIARVAPNVTATSRTLTVEAEVDNGAGALKPGQFATVRILLPQSDAAVLVPSRAVRTESGVSRLFVIRNGKAELHLVQLGQTDGDLVEVKSGVAAGDPVATSNVESLSDGMGVKQ